MPHYIHAEIPGYEREEVTNHELIFRGTRLLRPFKNVVAQVIGQVKREVKFENNF